MKWTYLSNKGQSFCWPTCQHSLYYRQRGHCEVPGMGGPEEVEGT